MPDIPDIGYAMNLTPENAVEYFERKGYTISFRWRDTLKEAHAKAFTAAGAMKSDVLESLRGELQTSLDEGQTFAQFQENLEPKLKKAGWWGRTEIVDPSTGEMREIDVTPHRLRNIYRTNMQTSYSAGRYKHQWERRDRRPYWMYVAIIDQVTRPSHEARNQTVLKAEDPWWEANYPPNGWGCRCRVRTLSERAFERMDVTLSEGENLDGITDEGWDYNPGKAASWDETDLSPDQLPTQRTWSDYDLPDVPDADKLQGDILDAADDTESAHRQIAEAFDVSQEDPVRWIESPIEDVPVNYNQLEQAAAERSVAPERYAGMARQALEDPTEIFLTLFEDGKYRKVYNAFFEDDGMLTVLQKLDGTLTWQMIEENMNENRKGDALLYNKENS